MSLAHFSFYPTDYLGDLAVRACSYEAQGVYVTLLCLMWQAKEGACSLPVEPERVAKLLGMDVRRWKRIYKELGPLFTADPASMTFTQERLRREWLKAKGLYDRAVKARAARQPKDRGEVGAKSAGRTSEVPGRSTHNSEPKRAEKHEIGSEQEPSNQNQNQNQKKIRTTTNTRAVGARFQEPKYPTEFEAWWKAYPNARGSKAKAAELYAGWIKSGVSHETLSLASANQATDFRIRQKDPDFIPYPATFLAAKAQPWRQFVDGWKPPAPRAIGRPAIVDEAYRAQRAAVFGGTGPPSSPQPTHLALAPPEDPETP